VRAAPGGFDDGSDRIAVFCIDRGIRAETFGMRELVVVNIDRAHVQAHRLRILNAQMPQAADARDHNPFTRPRLGFLDAFVRGDAGTDEGRRVAGRQMSRDVSDIVRIRDDVFGKTAVLRIATELRFCTHRLACGQTKLAVSAARPRGHLLSLL
jgi:hypothetical protein